MYNSEKKNTEFIKLINLYESKNKIRVTFSKKKKIITF